MPETHLTNGISAGATDANTIEIQIHDRSTNEDTPATLPANQRISFLESGVHYDLTVSQIEERETQRGWQGYYEYSIDPGDIRNTFRFQLTIRPSTFVIN